MAKRAYILALVTVVLAALAFPLTAHAEHFKGSDGWTVTFNEKAEADNKLIDNFTADDWADEVRMLQPGDDITFTVKQIHEHATAADWYMSNEVLKSLEEGSQSGSAYGYVLTYTKSDGQVVTLFDSATVGGTDSNDGLKEATDALDEYFYLDTLKKGETSQVDLVVTLDGETEGNAYFDTLAQLKMKFAVELNEEPDTPGNPPNPSTPPPTTTQTPPPSTTTSTRPGPVQTGDNTNLFPFYVAMTASGAVLLGIGIWSLRRRRRDAQQ